jgi:hypothetical protein
MITNATFFILLFFVKHLILNSNPFSCCFTPNNAVAALIIFATLRSRHFVLLCNVIVDVKPIAFHVLFNKLKDYFQSSILENI